MHASPHPSERPPAARSWPAARTRIGWVAGLLVVVGVAAVLGGLRTGRRPEPFAVAPIQVREAAPPLEAVRRSQTQQSRSPTGLTPAPDPRLVEKSRFGLLPRIGSDGTRPARAYARPAGSASGPRIALLVGGLGISQSATGDAIAQLPPPVTLAFGPYGTDLERAVAEARDSGHEVMLEVPMEPFDYPDNDPGPHTLKVRAPLPENIERLQWVMGRTTGYTGLVNTMGARLLGDDAALVPILNEIAARGLLFLDDGSVARSAVKAGTGAPVARADVVVGEVPRGEAIDRELERVETLARERGLVIATASLGSVTLDRVSRWVKTLDRKGIQLVPISSAYPGAPKP